MRTLFHTKEVIGIDTLDFTGNLNGKGRRIESGNAPDAASSIAESIPKFVSRITKWGHAAEAADDNPIAAGAAGPFERHTEIIHRL